MTLEQLAALLPNGLHDAELHKCTVDYSARFIQLDLKLWVGNPEKMEIYRPATVELDGMHFWIVEPPDQNYLSDSGCLTIDTGEFSTLEKVPAISLPEAPQSAFMNWIYVHQWNAFIYVSADTASYRWTGPDEDRGLVC